MYIKENFKIMDGPKGKAMVDYTHFKTVTVPLFLESVYYVYDRHFPWDNSNLAKLQLRVSTVVELFFLVIWHHKKLLYLFYLLILQNIQH